MTLPPAMITALLSLLDRVPDATAAGMLDVDVDTLHDWRAQLQIAAGVTASVELDDGQVTASVEAGPFGVELTDEDGDGDLEVVGVWNGKRMIVSDLRED